MPEPTTPAASSQGQIAPDGRRDVPTLHRIEWRLTNTWGVRATIYCDADRLTGRCYNYCPIAECEDGCVAPDEHEQSTNPTCNVIDWLSSDDVESFYQGPATAPRDGHIQVWFDRLGIAWCYPDEAADSNGGPDA